MTDVTRPGDGDSELGAPLDDGVSSTADGGAGLGSGAGDVAVRRNGRARPSNAVLLLGAILVIVIAQLVATWFVLSATTQSRDQYTAANGLQRCLIRAQLNVNQATDPTGTGYKTAVGNCLK
ncbi:MAG: hypothetical protein M3019_00720 [Candidatus Dormibacteraeota bacterium]|nr:hypothetical protein [Candidatus Dormibacteraeota bacterium]